MASQNFFPAYHNKPSIDLHLIFGKSSFKNKIGWTWFFVYFKFEFILPVSFAKLKIFQINFLNSIFHQSSADQ